MMYRALSWMVIALAAVVQCHQVSLADNYVVVVIDDSGSMDELMSTKSGRIRRIDAAKNALRTVLGNIPDGTKVGLFALNRQGAEGNWLYPLATAERDALQGVVDSIEANGGTPLGRSMKAATDSLLAARDTDPFGTFRLLVVTDGEATDAVLLEQYIPDIVSRGITIDVIGVDMQNDHSLATKVHQYRRADDAESLNQAVAAVFAESGAVDDQGGESDFDVIASLPDEFAAEALAAISKIDNRPVGERETAQTTDAEAAAPATGGTYSPPPAANQNNSSINVSFGGICCCFGTLIVIGVILVSLMGAAKKRR
jgi:hypothetical protein